ncbi:VCBS repeat-containing protein [Streptomyces globisporus]|uniref:FG-GAP repeat domain-containing protein n=1 Tax=Streptomyces globisporus TaxID=1908 RepID=UPI000AF7F6BB|nr:VCBS repeat-containing protein [Streptomyces globisporus]
MRTDLSRRVSLSVGVVLAVAAVTPFVAPAATAAPVAAAPAAVAATAPAQVPFLASGGQVAGAGKTGFLTRDADGVARWTRYADGVSKVVGNGYGVHGSASDIVVTTEARPQRYGTESATVYDMATGAAPVTFGDFWGQALDGVGAAVFDEDIDFNVRLVTQAGSRAVAGLQNTDQESYSFSVRDSVPGTALAVRKGGSPSSTKLVVVDIAGARVTETYPLSADVSLRGASITQGRVVWAEVANADGKTVLASAERGSTEVTRVPLPDDAVSPVDGGLMGDWLVSFGGAGAERGLRAYPLAGGAPVELLDHAESVHKSGDGTVLALGTTADRGPGVYRIAPGADGKPAAELIASTGQPPAPTTPISFTSAAVPATLNLDAVAKTRLSWKFSTTEADLSIDLRHKKSGQTFRTTVRPRTTGTGILPDGSLGIDWAGEVSAWGDSYAPAAPNGAYEWTVTARPWNGMPSVTTSGTFEVTRTPKPHDYTDNGSPDLFARRTDGGLAVVDTRWDDATGRLVVGRIHDAAGGWTGWNTYDRVEAVGDIADSTVFDTVARDKAGVLWLHAGTDPWTGKPPVRVGGGWNTYTQLSGGSDLTGDGRADLVAVDKVGDLYLYKSTGVVTAPFVARKKIGFGWGIYNQITAVGNVGGGPAGDLVARDKDGVLWLYLGKGDGTFAPRTRIGGGWNAYADVVGIGDGNKDGRPDLYARTAAGAAYFHAGTGDWKVPFKARATTGAGVAPSGTAYDQVS